MDVKDVLGSLTCFVVTDWGGSSSGEMSTVDRHTGNLRDAHVASSLVRDTKLHKVVIDVDHEAVLVPSSTPGHHHLYVDIPPVRWDDYVSFLQAAAKIGLVEQGYVDASIERGHTDVRLPWVQKNDLVTAKRPMLRCGGCKALGHEIEEYVQMASEAEHDDDERRRPHVSDNEVLEWIWDNEGTLNRETGFFLCTKCYIDMGQPSGTFGNADARWVVGDMPDKLSTPSTAVQEIPAPTNPPQVSFADLLDF